MAGYGWESVHTSANSCYGLAFLTLVPLSEGILLGSVQYHRCVVVGRILFKEKLTPLRLTGILLVASGVAVVGAFS